MTDRIDKQLRKLDTKQREVFIELLKQILRGDIDNLDVVKLKGSDGIFRVRKGAYRIIFQKNVSGVIKILAFERRSETTYKSL